jgi:di/tricarboxylate transporter
MEDLSMVNWKKVAIGLGVLAGAGAVGYLIYTIQKAKAEEALREEFHKLGDVNRDGVIDIYDLVLVEVAYGSKPGDPYWNPDADLNGDGIVDDKDVAILTAHYGLTFEEWVKTR